MLFLLYSLISQIYAESLRKTVVKYGYPEDKEQISWTIKNYFEWVFFCYKEEVKKDPEEENKQDKEKVD